MQRSSQCQKGAERKQELGYYFNQDFDVTMNVEIYDENSCDEFSGSVLFSGRDGVLTVSGLEVSGNTFF